MSDDQALMRQLQEGDDAAFEQIVRRWEQPMLNFFYRSLGDLDAAEDLRQDLFVRVYAHRAGYRGDGTFRAWLYQLATNLLRTHMRRRRNVVSLDDTAPDDESESPEMADRSPALAEVLQRRETARLVREMLAELPDEDREPLMLRFYERLHYREMAQALGAPEPTVKSRVYRALERLRQLAARKGLTAGEML